MDLKLPGPLSLPALLNEGFSKEKDIPINKLQKPKLTIVEQKLFNGLSKLTFNIIIRLRVLFHSDETKNRTVIDKTAFTRRDTLTFSDLLVFLQANLVGSLDDELAIYFQENAYPRKVSSSDDTLEDRKIISEAEISKIRNEINDFAFRRAFEITRDEYLKFKEEIGVEFSDYAVDGSVQPLPNKPAMKNFFGVVGKGDQSPGSRLSEIIDTETSFIIDAVLAPLKFDERTLFLSQFTSLASLDWFHPRMSGFIFDRGYHKIDLFEELSGFGTYFLFRVKLNTYGVCELDSPAQSSIDLNGRRFRLLKFKLSTGEDEALLTNMDERPFQAFHGLYHLRWIAEIAYYFLKHKERLGDFNGSTPNSIYQSFWVNITFYNITVLVKMQADILIEAQRRDKQNKHKYEANWSEIVTYTHLNIIKALVIDKTDEQIKERTQKMVDKATQFTVEIRENEFSKWHKKHKGRIAFYSDHIKVH